MLPTKDLENALAAGIAALTPVPAEAVEQVIDALREMITFDRSEKDNAKWLALLREHLPAAKTFEIHCWSEEPEWIELALRYGTKKDTGWQYGTVIEGPVTEAFSKMLLELPKPADIEIYNKMTPFFNVFLDSGFSSSHYGTEVFVGREE